MTKGFQSSVNLAYRLESLKAALARMENLPQPESENEARRLVTLLRASCGFRGMEALLQSAQVAEQAPPATFPAKLRDLISEIQQALEQAPRRVGTVMIVSSDAAFASRLAEHLSALHHQTLIADSASKAKELIVTNPVAFCIVDIVLTDLDGRALITDLRTHPETAVLPIIAISPCAPDPTHEGTFHVFGADSVFSKNAPFEDIANYLTLRLKRTHMKGLQARRDQVTGLPNRAACYEIFRNLQGSIQENDPMAFILIGIHQFAGIAQTCTPLACDELMRKMGAILSSALRATDVVARWDATEFAILLTGEDHFGATKAIDKVLPTLSELSIMNTKGEKIPVLCCAGITINNMHTSIEDAALRAESHLYMAFSEADSPSGGKQIVSDAIPLIHREEPVALCLTNTGMAKVIKQILERETFRVEIFTDTESVFQRIKENPFSLLILDDELPQESGFRLLQRLNEQANTNVMGTMMMVSQDASIERVMKLGANDYFIKPPTMPSFLSQIRRVISHNSSNKPTPGVTIMVADHELPQLLMAGTTLHQLGTCQILLAKGAADALQRLKNSHPEYLVLDAQMPTIDITNFLKQIETMEWLKNTKVILSMQDPASSPPRTEGRSVLGVISRPYLPLTLLNELRKLIPALPKDHKGLVQKDPRLLELEIQRILALKT